MSRTFGQVVVAVDGVTAHVLRHSYATVAHELNFSELTIAGLLGHSSGSVTAQYAHHVDSTLVHAADRVSEVIRGRLGGINQATRKVINPRSG